MKTRFIRLMAMMAIVAVVSIIGNVTFGLDKLSTETLLITTFICAWALEGKE